MSKKEIGRLEEEIRYLKAEISDMRCDMCNLQEKIDVHYVAAQVASAVAAKMKAETALSIAKTDRWKRGEGKKPDEREWMTLRNGRPTD